MQNNNDNNTNTNNSNEDDDDDDEEDIPMVNEPLDNKIYKDNNNTNDIFLFNNIFKLKYNKSHSPSQSLDNSSLNENDFYGNISNYSLKSNGINQNNNNSFSSSYSMYNNIKLNDKNNNTNEQNKTKKTKNKNNPLIKKYYKQHKNSLFIG